MKVWAWPIALGVLTAAGLVGALVGNGAWDWMGWIGLGVPATVAVCFAMKRRGRSR